MRSSNYIVRHEELHDELKGKIAELKKFRQQRLLGAFGASVLGTTTLILGSTLRIRPSPDAAVATATIAASAGKLAKDSLAVNKKVRNLTNDLGSLVTGGHLYSKNISSNLPVNHLLTQYKYVFVNRRGDVVFTNKLRKEFLGLKFGRMRSSLSGRTG